MPRKETTKKAVKVIKKLRAVETPKIVTEKKYPKPTLILKLLLVIAIGIVVFLLVQKNRSLFIAGTVNKSPIYRWELNAKMAEKYGTQTLEGIVAERLLDENIKKNKIVVADKEVQDELSKIKTQYGGEEQYKTAIAQFGLTEAKALESIKQSLGLKRLIEKLNKVEITEAQIAKYFEDNKSSYVGKKLAEVSAEIKDVLYQQEIYTKSQDWFTQIRKEATVSNFLKP